MYMLKQDPFYRVIAKYPDCAAEYCVIKNTAPYKGEPSHRSALTFAIKTFSAKGKRREPLWEFDISRAEATEVSPEDFFFIPKNPKCANALSSDSASLPYWRTFLAPPHGNAYGKADLIKVNSVLFPCGMNELEIYAWTTDWTNYFDDGREWWGALCATVYDRSLDRFVTIMASATD